MELPESARKELDERFVLIYTGQRRLARNLLRDVVGRYVGNEPDSLYALEEIQKTAALMRFELERGNVDGFAKLLDYHWELSKKVDAGSSNTLIEQIFSSIEEMIDEMTELFRKNQIDRMQVGKCSDEGCVLYSEMVTDFDRIGDHI